MRKTYSKRKFIGIFIIFAIFICLSSVAAQDPSDFNLTNSYSSINEISHDFPEGDYQNSLSDDGKPENSSDEYTFESIQNEIDANPEGTVYLKAATYAGNSCINIEKSIRIIGVEGSTVLDAKGQSSIFVVNAKNVSIINITFANASGEEGSAIQWNGGDGIVLGCNFINGHSTNKGGAICWCGDNGSLADCSFVNNSVSDGADALLGGAIYWEGSNGSVSNCSFSDNHAAYASSKFEFTGRGSAIHWDGINGSVFNCTFIKNNADIAGAIYWNSDDGSVFNCTFEDNIAGWEGGAIYWKTGKGRIIDCDFIDNIVDGYEADYGGAICWNGGDGSISNCNFVNNHAPNAAGAVYWITGSSSILNSNFTDNHAPNTGGAIYWGAVNVFASNCSFINNHVDGGKVVYGGAIYCEGLGSVLNCSFSNNTAGDEGGAIRWHNGNSLIFGCTFENNTAENGGGAISHYKGEGNVSNCSFVNNSGSKGGAILLNTANSFVSDCSFANNTHAYQGGAIYANPGMDNVCILQLFNCSFESNSASEGGAIYGNVDYADSAFNLQVSDCSFENNSAGWEGGAVYWVGGNCSVSDCMFLNNYAAENGSSIYCSASYMVLSISNCRFVNNSANGSGVVYYQYGHFYVVDCSFENNSARECGVIFCEVGNCVVSNSSFTDNTAGGDGGAIYGTYSDGIVLNCSFMDNFAKSIVYFDGDAKIQVNNNIFLNNKKDYDIINRALGDYDVDYNWFGHNSTNFDQNPATSWDFINKWLFLNATANPIGITLFNSSDVAFNLFVYDKNTKSSNEKYDQNLLKTVNLTITSSKGSVNKKSVNIGDAVTFTPSMKGKGMVTATIRDVHDTIELDINDDSNIKAKLDLTEASYGESINIALSYNPNATGTVNVIFNGKKHDSVVSGIELNETISVPLFIPSDEYAISIVYSGDEGFITKTITLPDGFTVKKINSTFDVESYDNEYFPGYEALMFRFTLPENATGNILMDLNGIGSTIDVVENGRLEDGFLVVDFKKTLDRAGQYNLTAIYMGDDVYRNSSVTAVAHIFPKQVQIWINYETVSLKLNDTFVIDYVLFPTPTGSTVINSSDLNVAQINQDTKELKACGLGNATVTINFYGDGNYTDASASFKVNVSQANSNPSINPIGTKLSNLSIDSKVIDENGQIVVILADDATGNVTIEIGENYTTKADNGKAIFAIKGLSAGKHDIRVYYSGDDRYAPIQLNSSVNVSLSTKIIADGFATVYNGGKYLTVSLKDAYNNALAGQIVSIRINGVTKSFTTDSKGQVKITTNDLAPKNYYSAVISFYGAAVYLKSTKSVSIIVKKATPKLTAKAKTFRVKAKTKKYVVTLKTNQNKAMKYKKVTIKVNKRTYSAKTNSKGQATFKLTKLTKKGKFIGIVKYAGSKYYNAKSIKVKITVK